jgi:hypothetical protein
MRLESTAVVGVDEGLIEEGARDQREREERNRDERTPSDGGSEPHTRLKVAFSRVDVKVEHEGVENVERQAVESVPRVSTLR